AVVGAALDVVELVTALRRHLDVPETAVRGIEGEPERIAVAERPDLGCDAALIGEGIVIRNGAVHVEPDDLAHRRLHVLGRRALLPLAGADPQVALAESNALPG